MQRFCSTSQWMLQQRSCVAGRTLSSRKLQQGTQCRRTAMSFRKGTDTIPKLVGSLMSGIIPLKRTPRTMKYPYTLTAKIAHFPYAYYWKNNWLYRYMCYATVLCMPVFYKIQKLSYSEGNVKIWEEKRRKDLEPHAH